MIKTFCDGCGKEITDKNRFGSEVNFSVPKKGGSKYEPIYAVVRKVSETLICVNTASLMLS